jgi:hypothetical protein
LHVVFRSFRVPPPAVLSRFRPLSRPRTAGKFFGLTAPPVLYGAGNYGLAALCNGHMLVDDLHGLLAANLRPVQRTVDRQARKGPRDTVKGWGEPHMPPRKQTAFVAYLRVSTARQGVSGLGLEAQRATVDAFARQHGGTVVGSFIEVENGKRSDRPELAKALEAARKAKATLVFAKLDRLSRNVAFIANLMDAGVDFVACDQPFASRLTLHILAAVAEDEARRISERTKAALAAAKARGVKLGSPVAAETAAMAPMPPRPTPPRAPSSSISSGQVSRRSRPSPRRWRPAASARPPAAPIGSRSKCQG